MVGIGLIPCKLLTVMTANAQMLTVCRVSSAHWMHIILFSLITILVYIYPIFLLRIFLLIFEDFIRCNLIISSPTPPLNSSQIHPYLSTSSVGGKKKDSYLPSLISAAHTLRGIGPCPGVWSTLLRSMPLVRKLTLPRPETLYCQ